MTEIKHTPGPWSYCVEPMENGAPFGTVMGSNGESIVYMTLDPDHILANARLIASAPELLEACEAMIAWDDAEKAGPDYGSLTRDTHPEGEAIWRKWWDGQSELCARAFSLARVAIAKAKGEA